MTHLRSRTIGGYVRTTPRLPASSTIVGRRLRCERAAGLWSYWPIRPH